MTRKRILVVDDSASIRRVVGIALQREGYDITLAGDGQEAIERLTTREPDLVLTDLYMPRVDGLALLQHIKAVSPSLPVILWSTNPTAAAYVMQEYGAAACLCKTDGMDDLLVRIAQVLAARG